MFNLSQIHILLPCRILAGLCLLLVCDPSGLQARDTGQDPSEPKIGSGLDAVLTRELNEALAPETRGNPSPEEEPLIKTVEGRLVDPEAPLPRQGPRWEPGIPEETFSTGLELFEEDVITPAGEKREDSAATEALAGEEGPALEVGELSDETALKTRPEERDWGIAPSGVLLRPPFIPLEMLLGRMDLPLPAEVLERTGFRDNTTELLRFHDPLATLVPPDDYQVEPGWDADLRELAPERSPSELELIALARNVAPAVTAIRVWDAYGEQISSGCGFYFSEDGLMLTDIQVIPPDIADRTAYVTVTTGTGQTARVEGYLFADAANGFVVLQTDARGTDFLPLHDVRDFPGIRDVAILSLPEDRGLTLADASLQPEPFLSGQGWLRLTGQDSPGVPGSPVLDDKGQVIAMVALRVPEEDWLNYALPVLNFSELFSLLPDEPKPLRELSRYKRSAQTDSQYLAAVENLLQGQSRRAVNRLLRVVERYPRSAQVWSVLGLACSRIGASDEAINCHRRALALDPETAQVWFQLSADYISNNTEDPAVLEATREALDNVVADRPADKLAWLLLAETHLRLGDYEEAADALIWVIRLEPDLPRIHYLLAICRGQMGQISGAEGAIRTALALNERYAKAWCYLGLIQDSRQEFAEAAEAYRKTVDLEPNHPYAWMNLAQALRRSNQMNAARRAFRQHFEVERKLSAADAAES